MKTYRQLALILVLPLAHAACSSGGDTVAASGGEDLSSSQAGAAPNAPTCGGTANRQACQDCCYGADRAQLKVKDDAANKCTCDTATSACSAECAKSYCSTGSDSSGESASGSDDPCASCQPDFTTCDATEAKACDADPTCAAATKCYTDANCESKADGPDQDEAGGGGPPS